MPKRFGKAEFRQNTACQKVQWQTACINLQTQCEHRWIARSCCTESNEQQRLRQISVATYKTINHISGSPCQDGVWHSIAVTRTVALHHWEWPFVAASRVWTVYFVVRLKPRLKPEIISRWVRIQNHHTKSEFYYVKPKQLRAAAR